MAIKSYYRKPNKKHSNSNPNTPISPMSISQISRFNYKDRSILIPILSVTFLFLLLGSLKSRHMLTPITIYSIEVVNEFPHDPKAFTQGLLYAGNDTLFESTGIYAESSIRKVDLRTGKVEVLQKMDNSYFGEGLTLLGERLFQVTWKTNTGFIYDRNNISKFQKFTHQMQDGWGLATDGKVLFGSDGTSTLYQIDPQTLKVIEKHIVKYKDHEVRNLNELEFINREVWANVWLTDCIARISPRGVVRGWVVLPNLRKELVAAGNNGIDVLNGIAWDSDNNRLFVTGKLWPKLYEIKLHPTKKYVDNGVIEKLCLR